MVSPSLIPGGGKVYVVYDGDVLPTAPPGTNVITLSNQTVTGDGDFISNLGTNQPITFKDSNGTSNFTIPAGQSEQWYRFTTLGDGQATSAIRLTPEARASRLRRFVHGKDGGATSSVVTTGAGDPVIRVDGGPFDGDSDNGAAGGGRRQ